ncbi:MAG: glycoside hydrolase family 2 TIM barrel-domain containing protein [Thermoguttaceae bacterium]|jgi:beta-galactosidase
MNSMYVSAMIGAAVVVAGGTSGAARAADAPRQIVSFDQDWRFMRVDVAHGQDPGLDDSAWRRVDVPHDWAIEGPFNRNSPAGDGGGYLDGGIGWYRKTFRLPSTAPEQRVFIEFDGAYMDSEVWLNGHSLGRHPYGYTGFQHELTPYLNPAGANLLAVRLNVTQPCSRWYSGAGIFRHVRLCITEPVHIAHWGTYVSAPSITADSAAVLVRTRIANQGAGEVAVRLETVILDPQGKQVATQQSNSPVAAGGERVFEQTLDVQGPKLWSLETPQLYSVVSRMHVGPRLVDRYTTPFGIRTIEFTRDRGFLLNGKHVPLQGVCDHHDLGCLGSAVNRRAIERQLEILKSFGCNAIRTSHNPPAPELLELCDRMGLVVMDEAFDEWKAGKTPHGYGRFFDQWSERDLVSMLQRDRNHPCVIMWSIGNEIPEQGAKNGYEMSKRLVDICHREDPTRPTVSACNDPGGADRTGFARPLDVFGINYNIGAYRGFKDRCNLVGSETSSALSTRGEYNLVPGPGGKLKIQNQRDFQVTSYDLGAPGWGYTAETDLLALAHSPWVAGEFVWTGLDYIGEPTPYSWPARSSYFGIVDLSGFPKDRYYFYRSCWRPEPLLHLLPHWNWAGYDGRPIPVWAVTNCDSVELLLNGKSLGEKNLDRQNSLHLAWDVSYAPGTLKAIGKKGRQTVCSDEVRTAGAPKRLLLTADRPRIAADGEDLAFVQVRVTDADGRLCPGAEQLVRFQIEGPGTIAGVDNGDPTDHESFQADRHKVFHGLGLAVVKASRAVGRISLRARAAGLEPAEIVIESHGSE